MARKKSKAISRLSVDTADRPFNSNIKFDKTAILEPFENGNLIITGCDLAFTPTIKGGVQKSRMRR